MKLLIAVPTFENIMPEAFDAIYALDECDNDVDFKFVKGYDCAKARNKIVEAALEGEYDYTLMVDSDIVLPQNTLKIFLSNPCPIIMGLYPKKNTKSGETNVFKDNGKDYKERYLYSDLPEDPRFTVKGGGFGCTLIHSEVLRQLEYPYFHYLIYKYGEFLSEDLYFCSKARGAGYTIWADSRVRCGHVVRRIQYE